MSNLFEHCRTGVSSASQRYEKPEAMQINLLFAEAKYSRCSQSAISLCQSAAGGGCAGRRRRSDAPSAWAAAAEERIFRNCILAGFRSAGSRCENSGSSDDTCASARSGSTKQRSLLCPLSERGCRHPLLFAVLDLLVLLDQAKSTRKESVRRKLFERSFAMRKLLCASRNDDYLLVSCF